MKKRIKWKKGLAVLLSACMIFGMAPVQVGAEETGEPVVSRNEPETKSVQSENNVQTHDSAEADTATSAHYDDNGFCTGYEIASDGSGKWVKKTGEDACADAGCNGYESAKLTTDRYDMDGDGTKDSVYEISNAGQLYWFAGLVNGTLDGVEQDMAANAILTKDITVNKNLLNSLQYNSNGDVTNGTDFISWIGPGDYQGTFNGNNKKVSGLYFNAELVSSVGLIGTLSGGKVLNVGVVDSYLRGALDVGGVCGYMNDRDSTIKNCYNAGKVVSTRGNVGGVCGYMGIAGGTITNCYNTGAVASDRDYRAGGVCGYIGHGSTITNCYNTGTVAAPAMNSVGGVCGYIVGGTITNCYFDSTVFEGNVLGSNEGSIVDSEGKTTEQFKSGEVAYALNQGNSDATSGTDTWKQILDGEDKESSPSLKAVSKTVYRYTTLMCDGSAKDTLVYGYTNDSSKSGKSIPDAHVYEIDSSDYTHHKCSVCNGIEAHNYTYKVAGDATDTIQAICDECDNSYTVKLVAPTGTDGKLTYTGTGLAARTEITDGVLGETLPDVEYASLTGDTESAYSTVVPKNVGNYRAKLTLGSDDNVVSATVDYTIAKAAPTIAWSENQAKQSATYTGEEIAVSKITTPTVTLLNGETFSATDSISYSYRELKDGTATGDFISGLPADIGTYEIKAAIPADGNYTAAETATTMQLTIAYLAGAPNAVVTDKNNKTYSSEDWCPSDIVLKAPDGYKISSTVKGNYVESLNYTGKSENEIITYYLKADTSGEIAEKSVTIKMDGTAPDFSSEQCGINIKKNWWNSLLGKVTFGLYKGTLNVNIQAKDSQSGVAEYYYYIDKSGSTTVLTAEELDSLAVQNKFAKVNVTEHSSGTTKLTEISSDNNYVIYAYAVDAVGNRSGYICSDGVVLDNTAPVITDVKQPTKEGKTLTDTTATITFTGSEEGTCYYILHELVNGTDLNAPVDIADFAIQNIPGPDATIDTWIAFTGNGVVAQTLTGDANNQINLNGLKANTSYILYLAATDAAGNASVRGWAETAGENSGIVSVSFTTTKTIPYVKTAPVLSGTYGDMVSAMLEKADMTKASVTAGQNSDTKIEGTWSVSSEDADEIPAVGTSEKYTLTFTPTGNDADTYDSVTCEVTPEVSKKPITIVIEDKNKQYSEENPEFTLSLATGKGFENNVLAGSDDVSLLGIKLSTTATKDSEAGTYAITGASDSANYDITFTGSGSDGKSGILTVKQADNEFTTELSCSDYTYAKDETPKPEAEAKFGTVTYKYAKADSDGKSPTDESVYTDTIPVNAGTYAVKAYVAETKNYAGLVSDPVVFTIAKKAKAPNMPGTAMAPAHSIEKVGNITLPEGWSWSDADKDTELADNTPVTATAVYTGTDKGNYETESVSIIITRSTCDHKNTEIRNQEAATCKKEGYTGDTYCNDCGAKVYQGTVIEKTSHTVGTAATCVSKAICSVCKEEFGEVDKTNHAHTTVKNKIDATCIKTGYTGDTYCADCGVQISKGSETAKLGHNYISKITKQPTTTDEGIRTYTCSRCNDSYTESIPKITNPYRPSGPVSPGGSVTPSPAPGETTTPSPTPSESATPNPIPSEPAASSPAPGESAEPSPAPGESAEPSPIPSESATPSPVPGETAEPGTTPKANGTKLKDSKGSVYKVTNAKSKTPTVQYTASEKNVKGTVTIPAMVTIDKVSYKVTSIADNAFKNNKKVTKVVIGSNIVAIGKNAFAKCTNITSITLGKNVTKIAKNAFTGCKKLKTITIKSKKLTSKTITKGAFGGISKKTVIKVPKSKYKAYKKLLYAKGLDKNIKIKKY